MNSSFNFFATYQHYMKLAFSEAKKAYDDDEVPVGAVIIKNNRLVARAHNQVERLNDPTAHAEMLAVTSACATLDQKYLKDCTLFVTLEPCPMCAGALVWSKISKIVFGASDTNSGACGSIFNLAHSGHLNHNIEVIHGIMEAECEDLLAAFFEKKRLSAPHKSPKNRDN